MSLSNRPCTILGLALVAAPAAPAHAAELDSRRIRTRNGADKAAVVLAMSGAQRKLRDPECRQLLNDFQDGEGGPWRRGSRRSRWSPRTT
jgi:hypothetical protein